MNTLCVPVSPHLRDYRKKAIKQMRSTYQKVAVVLVLDSNLRQINAPQDPVELGLRPTNSGWFRRLWTLQECAFARVLCVSFLDGIVNVGKLATMEANTFSLLTNLPGASMAFSNLRRDGWRPFHATRTLTFVQAGHLADMRSWPNGKVVSDTIAWHINAM
ncbi:MAG: hypothetical protein FRX48_04885 [Lasallia pustulata]|uniref:Heterokaryon incompatibility domain-containing protein n=1 Tax=Lasallia pustulata TaxID=136370 RepID=A0A5M8PRM0_9LECA|nr:MAG: hypothetical protein FRX48_04885 [Lasallia pustulata]